MEDNMRERQNFFKKVLFNLGIPVCMSSVSQSQLSIISNYIDMVIMVKSETLPQSPQ